MRFLVLSLVASVALADGVSPGQLRSTMALKRIMDRQVRFCTPVPEPSCSLSCGPGYVTCISWPTCYNPGDGQTCCSNGSYCDPGTYCSDAGCCPNGTSLEECGATVSLSTIAPPSPSTSEAAPDTSAQPPAQTTSEVVTTPASVPSTPAESPYPTTAAAPAGTPESNITVVAPSVAGPTAPGPTVAVGGGVKLEKAAAGLFLSCVFGYLLL